MYYCIFFVCIVILYMLFIWRAIILFECQGTFHSCLIFSNNNSFDVLCVYDVYMTVYYVCMHHVEGNETDIMDMFRLRRSVYTISPIC